MPFVPGVPGKHGRLYYRLAGHGPIKVLMTMGMAADNLQWEPQWDFFAGQPDDFEVCAYDNRGIGLSDAVGGRWTTAAMARDAIRLLDHLGWRGPRSVHLVGMSMGGMITMEIALADLGRFASIALIATTAGGPAALMNYARIAPTGLLALSRAVTSQDARDALTHGLEVLYPSQFLSQSSWNPKRQCFELNSLAMARGLIRRARQARKLGAKPASQITMRKQALAVTTHFVSSSELAILRAHFVSGGRDAAVVITGSEDILVHPSNSRLLCRSLRCRLLELPGAGHGVNEQCVTEVNTALTETMMRGRRWALQHQEHSESPSLHSRL